MHKEETKETRFISFHHSITYPKLKGKCCPWKDVRTSHLSTDFLQISRSKLQTADQVRLITWLQKKYDYYSETFQLPGMVALTPSL